MSGISQRQPERPSLRSNVAYSDISSSSLFSRSRLPLSPLPLLLLYGIYRIAVLPLPVLVLAFITFRRDCYVRPVVSLTFQAAKRARSSRCKVQPVLADRSTFNADTFREARSGSPMHQQTPSLSLIVFSSANLVGFSVAR